MTRTDRLQIIVALTLAAACSQAVAAYTNTTAGGTLRPGVYGRIEVGRSPPPPVIYAQPVIVTRTVPATQAKPVYLYVPSGQVRRWAKHCGKYRACELPVYFVRMDDNPGKLGKWKNRTESEERTALRLALRSQTQSMSVPPAGGRN